MSAFDYSKFDKIVADDSEEQERAELAALQQANDANGAIGSSSTGAVPGVVVSDEQKPAPMPKTKKSDNGRFLFEHEGRTIYEWEQVREA